MSDAPVSRADDLLDIYVAPAKVFARRQDGRFGLGLLVFSVAMAVLFLATRSAMRPIFEAEMARALAARSADLTPEQMEQSQQLGGTLMVVFGVAMMPLMPLILGVGVWVAARPAGASINYAQAAAIATFSLFPKLIESVVAATQALLMDERALASRWSVSLGIGRFLDPETTPPLLLSFLGRIDLFTLWVTALIAIGLRVMGRISTGSAVLGAGIVWLLGSIPLLLQSR